MAGLLGGLTVRRPVWISSVLIALSEHLDVLSCLSTCHTCIGRSYASRIFVRSQVASDAMCHGTGGCSMSLEDMDTMCVIVTKQWRS